MIDLLILALIAAAFAAATAYVRICDELARPDKIVGEDKR